MTLEIEKEHIQLFWWSAPPSKKGANRSWPIASPGRNDRRVVAKIVSTSPYRERDARTGSHGLLYVHVRQAVSGTLQSPIPWIVLPETFRRLRKAMNAAQNYINEHPEINWLSNG